MLHNREAQPDFPRSRDDSRGAGIQNDAVGRFDRDDMFLGGLETGAPEVISLLLAIRAPR